MRAVKNKTTKICACSVLPPKGKNGRRRRRTSEDWDRIENFNNTLEKYCLLDEDGNCEETSISGVHTSIGIVKVGYCRSCQGDIWEFRLHSRISDCESTSVDYNITNVVRGLPVPRLHAPTIEDVIEENEDMRWYEDDDDY